MAALGALGEGDGQAGRSLRAVEGEGAGGGWWFCWLGRAGRAVEGAVVVARWLYRLGPSGTKSEFAKAGVDDLGVSVRARALVPRLSPSRW